MYIQGKNRIMKRIKCPVCGNTNKYKLVVMRSRTWIECLKCGKGWDPEIES